MTCHAEIICINEMRRAFFDLSHMSLMLWHYYIYILIDIKLNMQMRQILQLSMRQNFTHELV